MITMTGINVNIQISILQNTVAPTAAMMLYWFYIIKILLCDIFLYFWMLPVNNVDPYSKHTFLWKIYILKIHKSAVCVCVHVWVYVPMCLCCSRSLPSSFLEEESFHSSPRSEQTCLGGNHRNPAQTSSDSRWETCGRPFHPSILLFNPQIWWHASPFKQATTAPFSLKLKWPSDSDKDTSPRPLL